jgi:hypothetical protein
MEVQEIKNRIKEFETKFAQLLRAVEQEHGITIESIYIRRGIQVGDSKSIIGVKVEVKI